VITFLLAECPEVSTVTWPQAVMYGLIAIASAGAVAAFFWSLTKM
jgi:hypothetical protein